MQGWILNKFSRQPLRVNAYGLERFKSESLKGDIDLRIIAPQEIDIVVGDGVGLTRFLLNGQVVPPPDFVLNRLGAASNYFTLAVMRQLENSGIYIPNSAQSVEISRDKMHSLQILEKNGIPIAKSILAKFPTDIDFVARELGFPVIVKTLSGSQGRGVYLCESRQKFEDLIGIITTSRGNPHFLIQEFISDSMGRDVRVFVVGGRVVGCMMRQAGEGSFKANYSAGAKAGPFPLSPLIQHLAVDTAQLLGLEIAGVDLLFDGKGFKVCEANSSPGFRGMEECCSVNIPAEIFAYIKKRIEERKNNFTPLLHNRHFYFTNNE